MFKELTDELLDLTTTVQGYRKAFLAQRGGPLCCSCTCCCAAYM
jgi:streptolysin S family bacteriocin protoxin